MYSRFHNAALRNAYYSQSVGQKYIAKAQFLKGLPEDYANLVYNEFVARDLVLVKQTTEGVMVSLNIKYINDIKQFLNPNEPKDKPPIEDSISPEYEKFPFHITFGSKTVKGINAKYSYHKNRYDLTKIIVYISVENEIKSHIELGSFHDYSSLLSKAVRGIDQTFYRKQFTKADLSKLGKDIEKNRQPPKAIIDMLLYYAYIVKREKKYYQRTDKQLPESGLYSFEIESQPDSRGLTTDVEGVSQSGSLVPPSHQTTTAATAHNSLFREGVEYNNG